MTLGGMGIQDRGARVRPGGRLDLACSGHAGRSVERSPARADAMACGVWSVPAQAAARLSAAWARANTSCHGRSDAMTILTRRTLMRASAPILSHLSRMVPQVALANSVARLVEMFRRRLCLTSAGASEVTMKRGWFRSGSILPCRSRGVPGSNSRACASSSP